MEHFVSCHPDSRLHKYGRILYYDPDSRLHKYGRILYYESAPQISAHGIFTLRIGVVGCDGELMEPAGSEIDASHGRYRTGLQSSSPRPQGLI